MGNRYTEPHEIVYYECDVTGRVALPMLLNIVLQASEKQSIFLERGLDYNAKLGVGWVITNYEIRISRLPKVGEIVFASTEAVTYNKYFCYRDFWLHDQAGNECAYVRSVFVLMNLEKRKMCSVTDEIVEPYGSKKVKHIERFNKIPVLSNFEKQNYRVRYFDIDSNRHVNNSRYLNWMMDVLDMEFLMQNEVSYINIRYDHEVEYGNMIDSCWEIPKVSQTDLMTTSIHQIRLNELICAEAEIKWKKILE